jgi:hypothetical protein
VLEWAFSQDGLCRLRAPGLRCVSSVQDILRQLYARYLQFARTAQFGLFQFPELAVLQGRISQDALCQLCAPALQCASTAQHILRRLYALCLQCTFIAQCFPCQLSTLTELEWVSSQDVLWQLPAPGFQYVSSVR